MTAAERRAAETAARVASWAVLDADDRTAMIARLRNPMVRKYDTGGFGVAVGGDTPSWCADMGQVRRLCDLYGELATDLAAS